jgi:hypothetical protein
MIAVTCEMTADGVNNWVYSLPGEILARMSCIWLSCPMHGARTGDHRNSQRLMAEARTIIDQSREILAEIRKTLDGLPKKQSIVAQGRLSSRFLKKFHRLNGLVLSRAVWRIRLTLGSTDDLSCSFDQGMGLSA